MLEEISEERRYSENFTDNKPRDVLWLNKFDCIGMQNPESEVLAEKNW